MKRSEEKLNEWRALLEERKQKGLTVKEFCEEKNVTPAQFYYYQGLINKPLSKERTKNQNDNLAYIKPIQIVKSEPKVTSPIHFILPNNLQCVLPKDMSVHDIKAILEVAMSC